MNPWLAQPAGLPVPLAEDAPTVTDPSEDEKGYRIVRTEAAVFAAHPTAAHFRYPYVYGPYQLTPREWCVVRRIVDGRDRIVVADDGLTLHHHGFTENLAHAVLLAVDQPEAGAGKVFNVGDEEVLSVRQVVELIAAALGHELEIVSMPYALALPARPLMTQPLPTHRVLDLTRVKTDLGYRDLVPAREAVARTARWLAEHQPERGGTEEMVLTDPFDYDAEDRLITGWRTASKFVTSATKFAVEPGYGLAYSGPGGRPRTQAGVRGMSANGPLAGIKILDLSIALTGPYAVTLLADQGADVVKVERPGIGDIGRWVGVSVNGMSALFLMCNRGKQSIAVDVHTDEGRDIVRRLARDVDVVVQNYRPGVVERLGIGYDDLRADNENLVYASLSGFGPDGPYAGKGAYDTVIQAYGGFAASQGDPATGEPQFLRQTAADKVTALYAAQAITAALFARERGSGGQHLHLSMLDAVVSFLWADAAGNEVLLATDGSQPSSFVSTFRPLRFLDGWGIATPTSDADFTGMCRAFGVEGSDDPRVATIGQRVQHRELTKELIDRCYVSAAGLSTEDAMARLEHERVPCGVVLSPADLAADPHAVAIGLLVDAEHPTVGPTRVPRHPAQFAATPAELGRPAPDLGADTDEVLASIGLADQIVDLRARNVVA